MTKRNFPKFESHEAVTCFNCESDLGGSYWHVSHYAPGRGEFVQDCCKCGFSTWYDIKKRKAA
jgi:hypothetical protein